MGVTKMKPIKLTKRSQVNPKAGKIRGLWKKGTTKKGAAKKKKSEPRGFAAWYAENRNNESLRDDWQEAVFEAKQMGFPAPTFKEFARDRYRFLRDH